MFQMMNEERLVTGHPALSTAAVAYNAAYASERIRDSSLTNPGRSDYHY